MPSWAVSAHGSHQRSASRNYLIVPTGVEIVFYTPEDQVLYSDRAWMILAALKSNDEELALRQAHKVRRAYERIPNYTAYGTTDFACGIYIIGGAPFQKEQLNDGAEVTLYDLVYGGAGFGKHVGRIHWLACTEFDRPV